MVKFMDDNFLLYSDTAIRLYHDYAKEMPIFDLHNHLSAKDIAGHRKFHNLYELWLETDHYKWRAMRVHGVDEKFITGDGDGYEKYLEYCKVLPKFVGSPLYHWTHLELKRYFGIDDVLSLDNAEEIWNKTAEMMKGDGFDAVSLLKKMKVRVLCTTDDPADSLEWHKKIAGDETIPFVVNPSFRPDKYLAVDSPTWEEDCKKLIEKYNAADIKDALAKALDYFIENGCHMADQGFTVFREGGVQGELTKFLFSLYCKNNITAMMHFSPVRNNAPSIFRSFGPDAGCDSIGPSIDTMELRNFLQKLEGEGNMGRIILYNLNPADCGMLATMASNYGSKVQYGPAWWFNDNIRGMERQIDELMENSSLATSVGMLTDSRSFTSFVRHEYYRRILCNKIGELVEKGQYPDDIELLGKIVQDICYNNAQNYM